jgi:DNA-binding transcriptional ArsR family regulator
MLHALGAGEICVKAVAEAMGISQSLASHHLRLMHMMGLLRLTRHGRMCCYRPASRLIATILDQARALVGGARRKE